MAQGTSGRAPFGLRWQDGELHVVEAEAALRRLMCEPFMEHHSKAAVAQALNAMGYITPALVPTGGIQPWGACCHALRPSEPISQTRPPQAPRISDSIFPRISGKRCHVPPLSTARYGKM